VLKHSHCYSIDPHFVERFYVYMNGSDTNFRFMLKFISYNSKVY